MPARKTLFGVCLQFCITCSLTHAFDASLAHYEDNPTKQINRLPCFLLLVCLRRVKVDPHGRVRDRSILVRGSTFHHVSTTHLTQDNFSLALKVRITKLVKEMFLNLSVNLSLLSGTVFLVCFKLGTGNPVAG